MARRPEHNHQLRTESRERLLDAALVTFLRLGFERTTVRDIAQEAGVAQGLMYHYFRSKDDLLRAVCLQGADDVAEAFQSGMEQSCSPRERLEQLIFRSLEIVRERRSFWQLNYMLRHQPRTAELLGTDMSTWTASVRSRMTCLLAEIGHRDPEALARVLFGAIDGVAQHYVMLPDEYPLEETAACLARQFSSPAPCESGSQGMRGAR